MDGIERRHGMLAELKTDKEYIEWIGKQLETLNDGECLIVDPEPSDEMKNKLAKDGHSFTIDGVWGKFAIKKGDSLKR